MPLTNGFGTFLSLCIVSTLIIVTAVKFFTSGASNDTFPINNSYHPVSDRSLVYEHDNPDFYNPTAIELKQGVAFAAPTYWGIHLRKSKSLRVAFIGGSQTANGEYVNSFYESMNSTAMGMGWIFTVYNEGVATQYPSIRGFKFLSLSSSVWPNAIVIEPCLNCGVDIDCSLSIDNMKYFINQRYKQEGLELPYYYVFLEFSPASSKYKSHENEWLKITERIARPFNLSQAIEALSASKNGIAVKRGSQYMIAMMDIARFYGIPVLSAADVLFPSLIRFYLTHREHERWPYTTDGYHTSPEGCKIVADHILKPFFLDQMSPHASDKLFDKSPVFGPYPVDLRMYRSDQYKEIHIIVRGHPDKEHACYGTNSSTTASSDISFISPGDWCKDGFCKVKVDYLHSWDVSYVAAATCNLYAIRDDKSKQLISSVSIHPNNKCGDHKTTGTLVSATIMCSHVMEIKNDTMTSWRQKLSLEYRSEQVNRLACISGVQLYLEGSGAYINHTIATTGSKLQNEVARMQSIPEFYNPTAIELQQGTVFAAPKYWGIHLRKSKSLRVAFIGGSQTANGEYVNSFYESMSSIAMGMGWSFAVYNEGVATQYPSIREFKFLSLSSSVWPNVICIEPCLSCGHGNNWQCSLSIDNMKYFINHRYKKEGLVPPYYVFLELFNPDGMILLPPLNTTDTGTQYFYVSKPSDADKKHSHAIQSRGNGYAIYMIGMARFYGIPVLSAADVLFPSLIRFYLTQREHERWPYTTDGYHTSPEGCKIVADHILKPFFLDQMSPHASDKLFDKSPVFGPYPVDLRMYRSDLYKT